MDTSYAYCVRGAHPSSPPYNPHGFFQPVTLVISLIMHYVLTHWGRDKMAAIFQTTFSNAFSRMKMYEFRLRFHWILFLRFELTIFQHWFRKWLGADQATCHYLNQWWLVYRRIFASLGLNELNPGILDRWFRTHVITLHNTIFYMLIN